MSLDNINNSQKNGTAIINKNEKVKNISKKQQNLREKEALLLPKPADNIKNGYGIASNFDERYESINMYKSMDENENKNGNKKANFAPKNALEWVKRDDYRYKPYYYNKHTHETTWDDPRGGISHNSLNDVSHDPNSINIDINCTINGNNSSTSCFNDPFDLVDYDLISLNDAHRYYYTQSLAQISPHFPYYANQSIKPGTGIGLKQQPFYWDKKIHNYEEIFFSQNKNDILDEMVFDIKHGKLSQKHIIQPYKHDTEMTWYQILCGTCIRNGLLSLFSFILWLSLTALIFGWIFHFRHSHNTPDNHTFLPNFSQISQNENFAPLNTMSSILQFVSLGSGDPAPTPKPSPMLGFGLCLITSILVYSIYLITWVCGPMVTWICWGRPVNGILGDLDNMVLKISQKRTAMKKYSRSKLNHYSGNPHNNDNNDNNDLTRKLEKLQKSTPKLWLEVECSHQHRPTYISSQRRSCLQQITTLCGFCQGHYVKKITFLGRQEVPILSHNDVSPLPSETTKVVRRAYNNIGNRMCVPFHFNVHLYSHFSLHPNQMEYLNALKQRLYHANSFRDTDTIVRIKYQVGDDPISVLTLPFSDLDHTVRIPDQRVLPVPYESLIIIPNGQDFMHGSQTVDLECRGSVNQDNCENDNENNQNSEINGIFGNEINNSVSNHDESLSTSSSFSSIYSTTETDRNNSELSLGGKKKCADLVDFLLFSPCIFIWLAFCMYLPLLMLHRAGTRDFPCVNIKYLILGGHLVDEDEIGENKIKTNSKQTRLDNCFVDTVLINTPRMKWKWKWSDQPPKTIGDVINVNLD
jgi:hypothetical protein